GVLVEQLELERRDGQQPAHELAVAVELRQAPGHRVGVRHQTPPSTAVTTIPSRCRLSFDAGAYEPMPSVSCRKRPSVWTVTCTFARTRAKRLSSRIAAASASTVSAEPGPRERRKPSRESWIAFCASASVIPGARWSGSVALTVETTGGAATGASAT